MLLSEKNGFSSKFFEFFEILIKIDLLSVIEDWQQSSTCLVQYLGTINEAVSYENRSYELDRIFLKKFNFVFYAEWDQNYYYFALENYVSFVELVVEDFSPSLANDSYRTALTF